MNKTLDILIEARRLINKGWTKGALARSVDGYGTNSYDTYASEFCMLGSILRAQSNLGGHSTTYITHAIDALAHAAYGDTVDCFYHDKKIDCIYDFNDNPNRVKSEVIAAFDKAIEQISKTNE